jgi:hypothetical protein
VLSRVLVIQLVTQPIATRYRLRIFSQEDGCQLSSKLKSSHRRPVLDGGKARIFERWARWPAMRAQCSRRPRPSQSKAATTGWLPRDRLRSPACRRKRRARIARSAASCAGRRCWRAHQRVAPAGTPAAWAVCTSAAHTGEGNRPVINQPASTSCIDVPILESTVASHSMVKARWPKRVQRVVSLWRHCEITGEKIHLVRRTGT